MGLGNPELRDVYFSSEIVLLTFFYVIRSSESDVLKCWRKGFVRNPSAPNVFRFPVYGTKAAKNKLFTYDRYPAELRWVISRRQADSNDTPYNGVIPIDASACGRSLKT